LSRNQRTIKEVAEVKGVGLHMGVEATVTLKPAEPDTGVVFVRTDIEGAPRLPLHVRQIDNTGRRTSLVGDGVEVHTIEHLLASLAGLRIDNIEIEMDGPEVPGGDGSSRVFVEALVEAKTVEQMVERAEIVLEDPVHVRDENTGAGLIAVPDDNGLSVQYTLDYSAALPEFGPQYLDVTLDEETFLEEISGARTFCLASEIEALKALGLGKGSTYENTLAVAPEGVIDNELRWPDEFVRHKVLDLVGDLFLAGKDIRARIVANRSGHAQNLLLVQAIVAQAEEKERLRRAKRGVLDIREIMRILPHRWPFLLIDRVIELDGFQRAVGIKNVTINEPFFQGHWPGQPIMPGVLQIEAMAQLAGVLLLRKLEHTGKLAVLLSIDKIKLRRAVTPGDQLRLEANALNVKTRTGRVQCRAWVAEKLVAEARINFMLTDA
jgi:UDP-3-O-[3-hydroxymyristoyl] N-acetylglucosamine deacetylase / 3-hydroxyacyl-[acyl-carrier-protein] dehydratase